MLNITKHQGNANQNHSKVSSRTCHYSYYQKKRDNKCSWGCREMRTLEHCWWESKLVQSWVQSSSHVWLFATPWTAAYQASLSLTISRSLCKFMSIESVMPSTQLILWCPLLLLPSIFSGIGDFPSESAIHIRWPKYWSFSFSISPSKEYSGLNTSSDTPL